MERKEKKKEIRMEKGWRKENTVGSRFKSDKFESKKYVGG